ncbi:hypothetical protein QBC35DRAFT_79325 [Podospora australis]|uniref:Rhodopsin domain-containing protein n=1 Tax=Podospora australis TaxID=1536484 RepID=A0AAN6X2N6_9PEZI|nr:hypothetical protein QBC35DRAFT_79325 [Podospora australis]
MDATSLLALPSSPAPSGLQIFALFVNFFFPSLALIIVSIRVAGRVTTTKFAIDDWLVCIAMLMSIAQTVISFFFIKTNFIGIPINQVPPHDPTQGLIWAYAVQILYNPILALVKSSVLIFLSRLFGQKDGVRRSLFWLNVANIAQMVAVFFAITLQCLPIAFNWDFSIRGGRCVDRRILYTCTAVFNIITDLLILGTPIWIFTSLKIPRRTKIALLCVFLLGFLVTITSIVRLVLLVQGLFNIVVLDGTTSNVGFVTSGIETNLALITACAPALRTIFRSRERGVGWFGRSSVAASRVAPDLEAGQQSVGWDNSLPARGMSGKFGRGGNRGGRKGNSTRSAKSASQTRSGRGGGKLKPIIRVKTDLAELRSASPRTSEEETMTANGIMRVSDVQREIDGIVKEIGVAGAGTYTGRSPDSATTSSTLTPRPKTPKTPPPPRPRPSMETITIGATMFPATSPPRPSTSGGRRYPPERYYSESIYPDYTDQELDLQIRDEERTYTYNEDRVSRRYGVVTPKGTTPTSRGWEGSGRPF